MVLISIVLPCRNEEKSIAYCITQIKEVFKKHSINGEIIVSDSSLDNSPVIAQKLGARVIKHNKKGYGIACLEGFAHAKGKYILMADCDGTYDFRNIPRFLAKLESGYDFVMGNRFKGTITKGAMPVLHQYVGNPVLSGILRLFFRSNVFDAHCGMRAFRKDILRRMQLRTTGMEFASEMVIKAALCNLHTAELPIHYHKRMGDSSLESFSDGWRHLRFMLMYSPEWLFFVPGISLFILGLLSMTLFMLGPVSIGSLTLYSRPILLGSALTIIGFSMMLFMIYVKTYLVSIGWVSSSKVVSHTARLMSFERGIMLGFGLLVVCISFVILTVLRWISQGFISIDDNLLMVAFTFIILAVQFILSVFFLSIMLIERKK